MRLVHAFARKYADPTEDEDEYADLVQAGTIGLIEAVDSFDETKGGFGDHATTWISVRIRRALPRGRKIHVPPGDAPSPLGRALAVADDLTPRERVVLEGRREGTSLERLAQGLGVSVPTVRRDVDSAIEKLRMHAERARVVVLPAAKNDPPRCAFSSWRRANTELEHELAFAHSGYSCPLGRAVADEDLEPWAAVKATELNEHQWGIVGTDDGGFGAADLATELDWPSNADAALRRYLRKQARFYRGTDLNDPARGKRPALHRKGIIDERERVTDFGHAVRREIRRLEDADAVKTARDAA